MRSVADLQVSWSFHEKQMGRRLDDREGLAGPRVDEDEWLRIPFLTKGESHDRPRQTEQPEEAQLVYGFEARMGT